MPSEQPDKPELTVGQLRSVIAERRWELDWIEKHRALCDGRIEEVSLKIKMLEQQLKQRERW